MPNPIDLPRLEALLDELTTLRARVAELEKGNTSHGTANALWYGKLEKALAEGREIAAERDRLRAELAGMVPCSETIRPHEAQLAEMRAKLAAAHAEIAGLRELIERGAALVEETLAPLWKKNNGFTDAEDELYTWKDSEVTAALARTPDQHWARIVAAGLRRLAEKMDRVYGEGQAAHCLTDEADRLERGE